MIRHEEWCDRGCDCGVGGGLEDALRAEVKALRTLLLNGMTVEHGYHDNPENHTLSATIFFGATDPRPLISWDVYGHGSLTQEAIDAAMSREGK